MAAAHEDRLADGYADDNGEHQYNEYDNDDSGGGDWDVRKAFVSRVPPSFDEDAVRRVFEEKFGEGIVFSVSILYKKEGRDASAAAEEEREGGGGLASSNDDTGSKDRRPSKDDGQAHRGFAFVTFDTEARRDEALKAGTVRGGAKPTSKRKHTLYIRPLVRNDATAAADEGGGYGTGNGSSKNACHLYALYRCPYGEECKFAHEGEGGCLEQNVLDADSKKKKRQKCFAFKKKGKCKLGDKCPFSHETKKKDVSSEKHVGKDKGAEGSKKSEEKLDKSEKDCLNWKTKGKCRKLGKGCPYRHDGTVKEAALAKKEARKKKAEDRGASNGDGSKKSGKAEKNRQPLSVRVFGLNYDTTENEVRELFAHCGPIVEVTFPKFEDSGRSRGYCGILFQSPKAVEKAVELHEMELHGRWLSVQPGKMYLKQWEERERQQQQGKQAGNGGAAVPKGEDELVGEFGQKVKKRKVHGYKQ